MHGRVGIVKTTFKVCGKRQNLTLSHPKTPKPIVTKFEWRDYVGDAYHQKEFGLNPQNHIYTPPVRMFTALFGFFYSPTGESTGPILMLNTSNNTVLHKEVPFLKLKTE